MKAIKKSMLVGAGVVTFGLAGLSGAGIASAATASTTSANNNSLVDKIASTFHLDKSKVQAVFDENRQSRMANMEAKRAAALAQAVTDGKITQAQADHITAAWKSIDDLRGTTNPKDMSTTTRDQIKQQRDALRDWLKQQNIDMSSLGIGGKFAHDNDADDQSTSTSTTTPTTN